MRGRRPRPLEIAPHDVPILQQIARSRSLPWYQVQRAQVLLAVAAGEPIRTLAIRTQCNPSTVWRICRRYEDAGLPDLLEPPQRAGRPARISALQRAQIVQLACLEPVAKGLHITHWTSQDLARQAVEDGIVPAISDRTVQAILNQVDLQPHRTRYWRTSRIDTHFKERAEKILWCYANAERLARRGFWVVCADEKPNFSRCRICGLKGWQGMTNSNTSPILACVNSTVSGGSYAQVHYHPDTRQSLPLRQRLLPAAPGLPGQRQSHGHDPLDGPLRCRGADLLDLRDLPPPDRRPQRGDLRQGPLRPALLPRSTQTQGQRRLRRPPAQGPAAAASDHSASPSI